MQLLIPCFFSKLSLCMEFCKVSGSSSRCEHLPNLDPKLRFQPQLSADGDVVRSHPPAGRRRGNARATPRCGAKRPMGCTSSAVLPAAARSLVLRRWRVPQPKDGRSCAEASGTTCISLTARPPRGQRSVCFLLGSCNCHLGSYFLWTFLACPCEILGIWSYVATISGFVQNAFWTGQLV